MGLVIRVRLPAVRYKKGVSTMSDVIIAGLLMAGVAGLPMGLIIAIGRDT